MTSESRREEVNYAENDGLSVAGHEPKSRPCTAGTGREPSRTPGLSSVHSGTEGRPRTYSVVSRAGEMSS